MIRNPDSGCMHLPHVLSHHGRPQYMAAPQMYILESLSTCQTNRVKVHTSAVSVLQDRLYDCLCPCKQVDKAVNFVGDEQGQQSDSISQEWLISLKLSAQVGLQRRRSCEGPLVLSSVAPLLLCHICHCQWRPARTSQNADIARGLG